MINCFICIFSLHDYWRLMRYVHQQVKLLIILLQNSKEDITNYLLIKGVLDLIGLSDTLLDPCYTKCLLTQVDMGWSLRQAYIQVWLKAMKTVMHLLKKKIKHWLVRSCLERPYPQDKQLKASLLLEFDSSTSVSFKTKSIIFLSVVIYPLSCLFTRIAKSPVVGFQLLTFIIITEHSAQLHIIMASVLQLT